MLKWLLAKILGRGISFSVSLPLKMPDNDLPETNLEKLTRLGQEAILLYPPKDDTTFCNMGVNYVCQGFGFKGFKGLTANLIVDRMTNAPEFAEVSAEAAQRLANDGKVVIAGIRGEVENPGGSIPLYGHGHVSVCSPGKAMYSGKWRESAPQVFNVGKKNGVMSANYAFRGKPRYYALVS